MHPVASSLQPDDLGMVQEAIQDGPGNPELPPPIPPVGGEACPISRLAILLPWIALAAAIAAATMLVLRRRPA